MGGTFLMGIYTLLQKRPTGYYYRQVVPKDLREAIGTKEITKSLKTYEHKLALSRCKVKAKETDELFFKLRNGDSMQEDIITTIESPTPKPLNSIKAEYNSTERGAGKTLTDAYEKWKDTVGNNKTREATELAIERFEQANGKVLLGAIETSHAVDYKDWLEANTKLKGRTINKQIDHIKSLVSFAHSNNWIKSNPLHGLRIIVSLANIMVRDGLITK